MNEDKFAVVFKYMDEEVQSHPELKIENLKVVMTQDKEIRRFTEIVKDATPRYKPVLYSRS